MATVKNTKPGIVCEPPRHSVEGQTCGTKKIAAVLKVKNTVASIILNGKHLKLLGFFPELATKSN